MPRYRRVALKDRIEIQAGIKAGLTASGLAKDLGFHKSTITREIHRHRGRSLYEALHATEEARKKFSHCRRPLKIQSFRKRWVLKKLSLGWSPDQIAQRIKMEKAESVSGQTIYRLVYRLNLKKTHLRFGYKRRGFGSATISSRKRNNLWRISIHERPKAANNRSEIGHWERDTAYDSRKKSILVFHDRKSRFTLLTHNPNLKAKEVAQRTMQTLKGYPLKTLTNDNGSEFYDVQSLTVPAYFCDVLKPGQRGSIENAIGLLRRKLRREVDLTTVSPRKLRVLQDQLNHRPRKCLDYQTPYEVFYATRVALAV